MYAAAGGASLASRQARQRQRQNKAKINQNKVTTNLPPKQPQQFPNYTDQAIIIPPKLSRVERNALKPPSTSSVAHAHDRRHSTSHYHLKTADHHQHRRLRESPSICLPVHQHRARAPSHLDLDLPVPIGSQLQLQLPRVHIPQDGDKTLERRCSFVRQVEEMEKGGAGILDRCNHMCNFEVKQPATAPEETLLLAGAGEYERSAFGSLDYPFSECSQGRTAWQERERGRRCSLTDEARQQRLKQSEAHHRWMKRNRIHDTSYGGSSDEDDYYDAYHQSAAANALLYVGLGTSAIGAIIFFVGTGDKGFKTLELRLIGPTLVACGLLCCLIRILLCACPSNCGSGAGSKGRGAGGGGGRGRSGGSGRGGGSKACPHGGGSNSGRYAATATSPTTIPAGAVLSAPSNASKPHHHHHHEQQPQLQPQPSRSKKKVSIAQETDLGPCSSAATVPPPLLLSPPSLIIPTITVPDEQQQQQQQDEEDEHHICIELQPLHDLDYDYELQSVSSVEESETVIEVELPKHSRTREPAAAASVSASATTAVFIDDSSATSARHSGIVLSPSQLQHQTQQ